MKKKTVNLKKLSLDKSAIASLNGTQQAQALGGATLAGDTSPCGPCPSQTTCPTLIGCPSAVVCPATQDCPQTGATYCVIC